MEHENRSFYYKSKHCNRIVALHPEEHSPTKKVSIAALLFIAGFLAFEIHRLSLRQAHFSKAPEDL